MLCLAHKATQLSPLRRLLLSESNRYYSTASKKSRRRNRRKMSANDEFDYLMVLDFEAVCFPDGEPKPKPQEIIEWPTLALNLKTLSVEQTFHVYIKPQVYPTLTPFCTELTGITQETVDSGSTFPDAFQQHLKWLQANGWSEAKPQRWAYVTCGDWDLAQCLPANCNHHKLIAPVAMRQWVNLKKVFESVTGTKPPGMVSMLQDLGLEMKGRHHSGIDDCTNIAQIVVALIQKGAVFDRSMLRHSKPLPRDFDPTDWTCPTALCSEVNSPYRMECASCACPRFHRERVSLMSALRK
eukprot:comp65282_c0_seq1/m.47982 comp65282_c0_seq1/g.47982  ORF comp65282_c0_seq1/g.47982 comp65282_c0_seq1/m.47982 type:complete len:297 (-) comp65282_c0_seq1:177-1067(-)